MNPEEKKENNFWEDHAQNGETNRVELKRVREESPRHQSRSMDDILSVSQNKKEEAIILPSHVNQKEIPRIVDEKKENMENWKEISQQSSIGPSKKVSHKKFYFLIIFLALFVLLACYTAFYFYKKSKVVTMKEENTAQEQLEETLTLLGSIAILPAGDEPVLAIVSDPSQLKNDAFFVDSQIGDRVIIYPKIGRAFLYRPSVNKIVNIISFLPNSPESENFDNGIATTTNKTEQQ